MEKIKSESGFTLIELLVVVAIIGILSSVVLASLNTARLKTRDVSRKTTLRQLQKALEFYYDSNGSYPATGGSANYLSSEPGDMASNNGGNWIPGLSPTYISKLPRDPLGGQSPICSTGYYRAYWYTSDGINYKLLSHCTPEGPLNSSSDSFYNPHWYDTSSMVCSAEPACSSW